MGLIGKRVAEVIQKSVSLSHYVIYFVWLKIFARRTFLPPTLVGEMFLHRYFCPVLMINNIMATFTALVKT